MSEYRVCLLQARLVCKIIFKMNLYLKGEVSPKREKNGYTINENYAVKRCYKIWPPPKDWLYIKFIFCFPSDWKVTRLLVYT